MTELKVTTRTGSVYMINQQAKTWARVSKTEESGYVRTTSGEYRYVHGPEVGKALVLVCDPLPESVNTLFRAIQTSDVVGVEEIVEA